MTEAEVRIEGLRATIDELEAELRGLKAHNEHESMLDRIVGTLEGYPDLGGDIRVMAAVDRIVQRSTAKLRAEIIQLTRDRNGWGDTAQRLEQALAIERAAFRSAMAKREELAGKLKLLRAELIRRGLKTEQELDWF